jgi:hypothetical protein
MKRFYIIFGGMKVRRCFSLFRAKNQNIHSGFLSPLFEIPGTKIIQRKGKEIRNERRSKEKRNTSSFPPPIPGVYIYRMSFLGYPSLIPSSLSSPSTRETPRALALTPCQRAVICSPPPLPKTPQEPAWYVYVDAVGIKPPPSSYVLQSEQVRIWKWNKFVKKKLNCTT